jgi:hypothetical protein
MLLSQEEDEAMEVAINCSTATRPAHRSNLWPQHRHAFIEKITSGVTFWQRANR